MKTNPLFDPSHEEIDALVSRYPLALVISAHATGLFATRLPLLLERNLQGAYSSAGRIPTPHGRREGNRNTRA